MRKNRAAWLAWALCGLGIVLAGYGLLVTRRAAGAPADGWDIANIVLNAGFVVVFGMVGALIVSRQPRNTIGWLLMVIALSLAIPDFTMSPEQAASAPGVAAFVDLLAAWLSGWSWWLLVGPLLLIPVLFPSGRPATPRWRWVIVSLGACFVIFLLFSSLAQVFQTADETQTIANPIGILSDKQLSALLVPWGILLVANVALCVSAILVRYRRAAPVERQQIKWLLLACVFLLAAFVVSVIFQAAQPGPTGVLFDLAVLTIPLAIGVAIVRYRLWDIDVIIRRTLVYALLTALLALAYFGSVVVLQNVFSALTGQAQSALVTVLSTLVIAALFVPLRARVQAVIDRRFFRRKYDAVRTLAAFSASLRDETNLDQLTAHLTDVVDETMQPAGISLWLKSL